MKGLDNHIAAQQEQHTDEVERLESENLEIQAMIEEDFSVCLYDAGMEDESTELLRVTMTVGYNKSVWEKFESKLIDKLRETLT